MTFEEYWEENKPWWAIQKNNSWKAIAKMVWEFLEGEVKC